MERLIHADSSRIEVGMITDFISFDAQIHNNCEIADNTFSLEMSISAWKAEQIMRGDYIYIDGSEFGGLVGSVNKNTGADTVTIKGILWRALLAMRIISPPSGQAYRAFTNTELNSIVANIVENDYVNLFHVSEENTGVSISCQFRYQTKLSGLSKALQQSSALLPAPAVARTIPNMQIFRPTWGLECQSRQGALMTITIALRLVQANLLNAWYAKSGCLTERFIKRALLRLLNLRCGQ